MAKPRRTYRDADGREWRVEVRSPSSSHALVTFLHTDPTRTREHRYAHYSWTGPESQDIASRIDPAAVLDRLDEAALAGLFRRSMAIAGRPVVGGRAY